MIYHQSTQRFLADNCGKCRLVHENCPYGECVPTYIGGDLIEKGEEDVIETSFYLPEICPKRELRE